MKKFYVYVKPEKGEPFRWVVGMKRRMLFWKKVVYSYLPIRAHVDDYKQLQELQVAAMKDSGRGVSVIDAELFNDFLEENEFWAVRKKGDPESCEWYTGKWYRDAPLTEGAMNERRGHGDSDKKPETSADIYDCQFFVREGYAVEALSLLNRAGYQGVLEKVYLNVKNVFCRPNIVTVCVNKRTGRTRYLKSYKEDDHRLRYAETLKDALLIFPEESVKVYEHLSQRHKDLSFTMIWKPSEDIAAKDLRMHEKELVQRMACDFYLKRHEEKSKQAMGRNR
jgi:hypothetical protein